MKLKMVQSDFLDGETKGKKPYDWSRWDQMKRRLKKSYEADLRKRKGLCRE